MRRSRSIEARRSALGDGRCFGSIRSSSRDLGGARSHIDWRARFAAVGRRWTSRVDMDYLISFVWGLKSLFVRWLSPADVVSHKLSVPSLASRAMVDGGGFDHHE